MGVIQTIEAIDDGHPTVEGWRYLWLKYVTGFKPEQHCAAGLVGPYSPKVRLHMRTGVVIPLKPPVLDQGFSHLYLCGVAYRGGWAANLHLAAEPAKGETAEITASTGTTFRISNARAVEIPGLERGFNSMPAKFTTCRCWQFGVQHYGLSSRLEASAEPAPPIVRRAK